MEAALTLLPVLVYCLIILLVAPEQASSLGQAPGWSFAAFSLFSIYLRDIVKMFDDGGVAKFDRNYGVGAAVIFLTVACVLMVISVARSVGKVSPNSYFLEDLTMLLFFSGLAFVLLIKYVQHLREYRKLLNDGV